MKIFKKVEDNLNELKNIFKNDSGIVIRNFYDNENKNLGFAIIYIANMIDLNMINDLIIRPALFNCSNETNSSSINDDMIFNKIMSSAEAKIGINIEELVEGLLDGYTVFLISDNDKGLIINTVKLEKRPVSEPDSEKVVRGPREGFTESLATNMSLLRRKIKNSNLKFQYKQIGELTKTNICICYIEKIVSPKLLEEVIRRLDKVKIDGILDSGYLQELIKDSPFIPFKTIGDTERPDTVAGKLLEGRVAILCDGSPFALTMPYLFIENFQINEDYYNNFFFASINRIIRWIGFFLTISVPAIYVSLVTFHQELIPTKLLLSISASRQGVPLPTIVEALLMIFVFELLREAGVRIPKAVGQTISIVGVLVIGQSAVEAKLVSAPMVIVASLTGITSFLMPKMESEAIIIRVVFLLFSGIIGFYGYIFGFIFFSIMLTSIRSFGVPYMLNTGISNFQDQKDTIIRAPWHFMYKRPKFIGFFNTYRKRKR